MFALDNLEHRKGLSSKEIIERDQWQVKKKIFNTASFNEKLVFWNDNVPNKDYYLNGFRTNLFYNVPYGMIGDFVHHKFMPALTNVTEERVPEFITLIPTNRDKTDFIEFFIWLVENEGVENKVNAKISTIIGYKEIFILETIKSEIETLAISLKIKDSPISLGVEYYMTNNFDTLHGFYDVCFPKEVFHIAQRNIIQYLIQMIVGYSNAMYYEKLKNMLNKLESESQPKIVSTEQKPNQMNVEQCTIFFKFLFKHLGRDVSNSQFGRDIEKITGHSAESYRKKLTAMAGNYIENLQIVRDFYNEMELHEIAQLVQNELNNEK